MILIFYSSNPYLDFVVFDYASPPGGNFSIICELCLPDWWDRTQPDAFIELIYLPRVDLFILDIVWGLLKYSYNWKQSCLWFEW